MQHIISLKDEELTPGLVLSIQEMVTEGTLDDPEDAGRLRRGDDIRVYSAENEVLHVPPAAGELAERMRTMCEFANGKAPKGFLHPVLRAVILHFWLAYDHPFVDGNGRTARALFYWSMLRQGYWLCEFISISQIVRNAPAKYAQSFLRSETDENDLTYFIVYHLGAIKRAISELHAYVRRKTDELRQLERQSRKIGLLNHRQKALVSHALRYPDAVYTFESHRQSHGVVRETARRDLLELVDKGYLELQKAGRARHFVPAHDLAKRLSSRSARGAL
jgi:Fic family protein